MGGSPGAGLGLSTSLGGCSRLLSPRRRRSRACAEERGAELGDEGQQPLHLHQPPPAPPGAAGAVSRSPLPGRTEAVAAGDRAGMLGTPTVLVCAPGRPSLRRSGRGEDLSVLRGRRARSRAEQRSPRAAPAPPASAGRMLSAAGDGVRARGWRGCVPRTGGGQGAGTPAPGAELAPAWPLALSLPWARSVTCPAGGDAVLALCSAGCHRRWLWQRPGATVLWALGAWMRSRCLAAPPSFIPLYMGGAFPPFPPPSPPSARCRRGTPSSTQRGAVPAPLCTAF